MIVLDASALIDVLADQEHADWLLDQMQSEEVIAPAHQAAEVLSAIARLHRGGVFTEDKARDALAAATALQQQLVVPSAVHLKRAFDLRARIRVLDGSSYPSQEAVGLTACHGLYVALAEERGVPLLTTDRRLVRADPPCDVLTP